MKNLLITGGSQGIGKATAVEAAKKGMFIGINYNSNDKAAEETLSEVKQLGGGGILLKCNVSNHSAVKDMFKNFTLEESFSLIAFFFATKIAFLEISTPIPLDFISSLKRLRIIHPEPVPMSKIVICSLLRLCNNLSINSSVSGLGIRVSLFT